ncbi:MAG: hypothetical protein ABL953_13790 [Ilumatobacteraceae bacterium]
MKQHTVAPKQPYVACARARSAFGMVIDGAFAGGSTTATNLTTRRLGTRTT